MKCSALTAAVLLMWSSSLLIQAEAGDPTVQQLLSQTKVLQETVESLNNTLQELEARVSYWSSNNSPGRPNVSFLAVLPSGSSSVTVSSGSTVHFTTIRNNRSPKFFGYDARGFFRCPFTATYFFFTSFVGYSSNYNQFAIKLEGKVLTSIAQSGSGSYHPMSISAIAECQKGQDVWVECTYSSACSIYEVSNGDNHFGGFLLF